MRKRNGNSHRSEVGRLRELTEIHQHLRHGQINAPWKLIHRIVCLILFPCGANRSNRDAYRSIPLPLTKYFHPLPATLFEGPRASAQNRPRAVIQHHLQQLRTPRPRHARNTTTSHDAVNDPPLLRTPLHHLNGPPPRPRPSISDSFHTALQRHGFYRGFYLQYLLL